MTEKRFTLDDGLIWDNGKEMTDVVGVLNALHEENENRKAHQRTLENKIRRLKDRVKVFEKNYSLDDVQRIKDGELKGRLRK